MIFTIIDFMILRQVRTIFFKIKKILRKDVHVIYYLLNIKKILHKSLTLIKHDFIYRYERIKSARSDLFYLLAAKQRSHDKSTRVRPCVRKSSQIGDMSALSRTGTTMLVNRHECTRQKAVVNCDHPQTLESMRSR